MQHRRDQQRTVTREVLIDRKARDQLGVVTTTNLAQVGVSAGERRVALRRGGLVPVHRGVYRPNGVRLSGEGKLRAAVETCGPLAVASHRCALWLWGLLDEPDCCEVSVPAPIHARPPSVIVHRSSDLSAKYRILRRGVPTTTPDRAILDGAAVISAYELRHAVEQVLIDRVASVATLRNILAELGRRGRRGAGPLRRYLDERALGDARAESQLEPLLARLCTATSVGSVHFQSTLELDGHRFRPDFVFAEAKVIVEVDGLSVHGSRDALDSDLARQNVFMRNGWVVLRYTASHLRRPAVVSREIAAVVAKRRRELGEQAG